MFLWFVAAAVVGVYFVFDSAAVDYRFVAVGGVLPLVETLAGRPLVLHTLLGSVALMVLVMAVTVGRRVRRRQLLGVPIGTFVFLVAAGVWTRTELFWWPFAGLDGIGQPPMPAYDRPLPVLLLLEAVGGTALVWLVRRFDLGAEPQRSTMWRTGRLPREVA